MISIRNIAVALDNTETDDSILKTLKYLSDNLLQLVEVHLVYVEDISEFDRRFIAENYAFEKANEDFKASMIENMKKKFQSVFGDATNSFYLKVDVLEGSPIGEFVEFCENKSFDMVVVGKKVSNRISRFAKILMRRTEIPVFIVPDAIDSSWNLNKILVPYDFSDHSDIALQTAVAIKGERPSCEILCFNGIDIPTYNSEIIVSYKDIMDALLEGKKGAFAKKLDKLEIDQEIPLSCEMKLNRPMGKEIVKKVEDGGFDIVIMGAKGHSRIEAFFIGSVTEKVLNSKLEVPVFVVR